MDNLERADAEWNKEERKEFFKQMGWATDETVEDYYQDWLVRTNQTLEASK